jgi:hypothetical protein
MLMSCSTDEENMVTELSTGVYSQVIIIIITVVTVYIIVIVIILIVIII